MSKRTVITVLLFLAFAGMVTSGVLLYREIDRLKAYTVRVEAKADLARMEVDDTELDIDYLEKDVERLDELTASTYEKVDLLQTGVDSARGLDP